jgi:hypothetical protein
LDEKTETIKYFTKKTMKPFFELLDKCEDIIEPEKYHPEENLLIHSLQVFNYALRETNDVDLLLAALLHDVGKIVITTGHESESLKLLEGYISCKTSWLIKEHMRVWTYIRGEMMRLKKCRELIEHPWFPELVQLARFDKLGRNLSYVPKYDKNVIIERLNKAVEQHWQGKDPFPLKNIKIETSDSLNDSQIMVKSAEIMTPFVIKSEKEEKK